MCIQALSNLVRSLFSGHPIPQIVILTLRILKYIRSMLHVYAFKATQALDNDVN